MIDKELVELLKLFNLTEYESKTYLALVIKGPSTVKGIREFAEIPYSREYDILQNLEMKGYVEMQPGKPKRFRAVAPKNILERALKRRTDAVEELLNYLTPVYDGLLEHETPQDIIWTIQGTENIRDRVAHMIKNAKEEILLVGIRPLSVGAIKEALKDASDRGVKIRALGMFEEDCMRRLEEVKAKKRYYEHDHSRFFLVDNTEMILASEDPTHDSFALYNSNPGCLKLYRSIFEHIWEDMKEEKPLTY